MVHVATPRPNIGSALGNALGGIGGQIAGQKYNQNQQKQQQNQQTSDLREALKNAEQVYSNPSLNEEQKFIGLNQALAAHPEMAKQVVGQFQQQQQQNQQRTQQEQALRTIEKQRGLEPGSLSGLEGKENVAAGITKPQNAPGGLTGQSVPPEVSQIMNKIIQENPNANSDELKMKLDEAGVAPIYSNGFVENRRRQDETKAQVKEKRIEAGNKRAEKVLEHADKLRETLPAKEASLFALEDAIENGNQSFFSLDNLAEMTGIEGFRTAKGGQFKTASKNFFINTLSRTGAKPNMFLEQQIAQGLPRIGRSKEGNLIGVELAKFDIDIEKKRLEIVDEISDAYEKSLGYVPGSFGKEVDKSLKQYVEQRQEQLANRLKFLNEQEKESSKNPKLSGKFIDVVGPDGNEYEIDESELNQLPQGYKRK